MGIIRKNFKDILYFEIEGFSLDNDMSHLFTSRIGWNQDDIFKDIGELINIPRSSIYSARQVHGTDVLVIRGQNNLEIKDLELDGLITDVKGIALCTYHADCVPIYFYDKVKKVIGMAHAGWKGTLNNIASEMINSMVKNFNSNLTDIFVALGPSIGPCCYEIGEDLHSLFKESYVNNPNIIVRKGEKIYLDLWEANIINLIASGIKKENIYLSDYCTACNTDTLYSYRREKGTKNRMLAVISLG
ncbi:MAG: peptidoglycan editing factor PgeF [Tissierellaceae bacterium]